MKTKNLIFCIVIVGLIFCSCKQKELVVDDYKAEIAIKWNKKIIETAIAEDNLLTLKGLRTITMVHIAMHDALNSIVSKYNHYSYSDKTPKADPITACVYAAYTVALNEFPNKKEDFDALLNKQLSNLEDIQTKAVSQNIGVLSAQAILKNRKGDKWNEESDYTWHPMAPGVYAEFNEHSGTPEGFVFGAGWATAKPFMLPKQDYFRVVPPPEINSNAYTKAFNEVKELGGSISETRTTDQKHLAMWWKEFVESSHNKLLRDLIVKENLNLWEATRSFALMNMSIYDAYINVFDNKFYYNHWRPFTAIRWAEHDGNKDTKANKTWNNLHKHTYPFPSYPSAHGTASTAAMTALANTLGKGDNYKFTMTQKEVDSAGFFSGKMKMNPPNRSFNSFSEAGLEASLSRIYLGIHFRYDSEEGHKLGAKIGNYGSEHFMKPITRID